MKQTIVLIGTIMLGIFISNIIGGDDEGTVKSTLGNVWRAEIIRQNTYP